VSATAPVLDAYVTETGIHACVWCAWCVRWHLHGHCGNGPLGHGDGHRWSHCGDHHSPYWEHGYYIREIGWWPDRPHWCALHVLCRGCRTPFYRNRPQRRWCGECPRQ
jgi:hypothetical protein